MSTNFRKFAAGIQILPASASAVSLQGDLDVDSVSSALNYHNGTTSSVVVTANHQATLLNKILSDTTVSIGNASDTTKALKFDLSGATTGKTLTIAAPVTLARTLTLPDATDTLVGKATTDVLTNKSIDGGTNTLTNIGSGSLAGSIPYSKLATLNTGQVLAGNAGVPTATTLGGDVTIGATGTVAIAALAVTAAKMSSGAASANQVATADGAGNVTYTTPLTQTDASSFYLNGSIAATVSANALTIALKTKAGSDATGGSPVTVSFRNATATTGTYAAVTVTSALSVVVPSGTTIGTVSGVSSYIYVYAINNAGAVELACSLSYFDEGSVITTVAVSGGANARSLYSTSARTGVACRLIGRIAISEAAAGTWASGATEVSNIPFNNQTVACRYTNVAGSTLTKSVFNIVPYPTKDYDTHGAFVTDTFTAPIPGKYRVGAVLTIASGATWATNDYIQIEVLKNGNPHTGCIPFYFFGAAAVTCGPIINATVNCLAGDTIKINCNPGKASAGDLTLNVSIGYNVFAVERIGN